MTEKKLSARERTERAVAEMADTVVRDTRCDWRLTRSPRRGIVAIMIALFVALPVAWLTLPSIVLTLGERQST